MRAVRWCGLAAVIAGAISAVSLALANVSTVGAWVLAGAGALAALTDRLHRADERDAEAS